MDRSPMRRPIGLWHVFVLVMVIAGVVVTGGAIADGRYAMAGIVAVAVGIGLPSAARLRRLRDSLRGGTDD